MHVRRDRTAIACLLIVLCAVSAHAGIVNGWQPKHRPKHTSEPQSIFYECWLLPYLPWCRRPADPKGLQPDVPECGTFVGPCQ